MAIEVGDRIEISAQGHTVVGKVLAMNNQPKANEEPTAWDHWDIEYSIENPIPGLIPYGRWKQFLDGGTIRILEKK